MLRPPPPRHRAGVRSGGQGPAAAPGRCGDGALSAARAWGGIAPAAPGSSLRPVRVCGPAVGGRWRFAWLVVGSGASVQRRLRPCAGAGKNGQDLADGALVPGWFWQRQVRLDLVAVAAAVLLLDHVAGLGQVGDDAVGAALGDAQAGRDVPQGTPGSWAMHSTRAWLVRKVQLATISMLPNSGNRLLVFRWERRVQDTHRTSAAEGGQLPGATLGSACPRPGRHQGRARGARSAAHLAEAAGARPGPGPGPWPGGCGHDADLQRLAGTAEPRGSSSGRQGKACRAEHSSGRR